MSSCTDGVQVAAVASEVAAALRRRLVEVVPAHLGFLALRLRLRLSLLATGSAHTLPRIKVATMFAIERPPRWLPLHAAVALTLTLCMWKWKTLWLSRRRPGIPFAPLRAAPLVVIPRAARPRLRPAFIINPITPISLVVKAAPVALAQFRRIVPSTLRLRVALVRMRAWDEPRVRARWRPSCKWMWSSLILIPLEVLLHRSGGITARR